MEETRIDIDKKVTHLKKESKVAYFLNNFNIFNPDHFLTIDIFTVLIGLAGFILAFGFSFLESTQK